MESSNSFQAKCFMILMFSVQLSLEKDYSNYQLLEIEGLINRTQSDFLNQRVDFWSHPGSLANVSFSVAPHHRSEIYQFLNTQNLEYKVRIHDLQKAIDNERADNLNNQDLNSINHRHAKRDIWTYLTGSLYNLTNGIGGEEFGNRKSSKPGNSKFKGQMNWHDFQRLEVIYAWLEELARKHSDKMKLSVLGHSGEGRRILIVQIGTGSNYKKPGIFIEAGIHAREWISPASVTYLMNQLVYDPGLKDLITKFDFFIVPVLNPDGYHYTHTSDRLWRKNRAKDDSLASNLLGCRGTDLNRNFGYQWGKLGIFDHKKQGSTISCLETYIGSRKFSENESQAVRNFILSKPGKFVSYLAFHSFGTKILFPWSYTDRKKVKDFKDLEVIGKHLARNILHASGGLDDYDVGPSGEYLYTAVGTSGDWARGVVGIKYVYLFELPGKDQGFLIPKKWILPVARSNVVVAVSTLARKIAKFY